MTIVQICRAANGQGERLASIDKRQRRSDPESADPGAASRRAGCVLRRTREFKGAGEPGRRRDEGEARACPGLSKSERVEQWSKFPAKPYVRSPIPEGDLRTRDQLQKRPKNLGRWQNLRRMRLRRWGFDRAGRSRVKGRSKRDRHCYGNRQCARFYCCHGPLGVIEAALDAAARMRATPSSREISGV